MQISLKEAFQIAVEVHGDQCDKAGLPYLFHVMRVAMAMDTDEERVVAILHDVLEDNESAELVDIDIIYGEAVGMAVVSLTRIKGEGYMDYIRRLSVNPLAVKVKLADLRDNLSLERLAAIPSEDRVRLIAKYLEAFRFLGPEPPPEYDMHE